MALAKSERARAADGKGCLGKAADDEPVFVLRAQDITAPQVIEEWVRLVNERAKETRLNQAAGTAHKMAEALDLAAQMRTWQRANGAKVPD